MRIVLLSERLRRPFDEGIKNFALNVARALGEQHTVLTLTCHAETIGPDADMPLGGIVNVPANRFMLTRALAHALTDFAPDFIVYVPTACATLGSFVRAKALKTLAKGCPVALVALQVRQHGSLARTLMSQLRPDLVIVQSDATMASLAPLGCRLLRLNPGIDLARFHPVGPRERSSLREEHGIASDAHVVLHVGHLNSGRNVQALLKLQGSAQVVLVGSTSTQHDQELKQCLVDAGIRVIDQYVPNIEQLYQLADVYVFPVQAECSAIDFPLSVLEAMACDLPVVSMRFGGLDQVFGPTQGIVYMDDIKDLVTAVCGLRGLGVAGTRELVEPYGWAQLAQRLVQAAAAIKHNTPIPARRKQ